MENELSINNVVLIFKTYIFFSKESGIPNFAVLKAKIIKIRKIEKKIAFPFKTHKTQEFLKKLNVP